MFCCTQPPSGNVEESGTALNYPGNLLPGLKGGKAGIILDSLSYFVDSSFSSKTSRVEFSNLPEEFFKLLFEKEISRQKKSEVFIEYFPQMPDSIQLVEVTEKGDSILLYNIVEASPENSEIELYGVYQGLPTMSFENDFFLIWKSRAANNYTVAGPISNFHRYGPSLNSFINENGELIIYFVENFGSGSGVWQFHYFFYKLSVGEIKPVLNWLQRSTFSWPHIRGFNFEIDILSYSPLIIRNNYSNYLKGHPGDRLNCTVSEVQILDESILVEFYWDESKDEYRELNSEISVQNYNKAYYLGIDADLQLIQTRQSFFEQFDFPGVDNDSFCLMKEFIFQTSQWVQER